MTDPRRWIRRGTGAALGMVLLALVAVAALIGHAATGSVVSGPWPGAVAFCVPVGLVAGWFLRATWLRAPLPHFVVVPLIGVLAALGTAHSPFPSLADPALAQLGAALGGAALAGAALFGQAERVAASG